VERNEFRRNASSLKAWGYAKEHGRGLLVTMIARSDTPVTQFLRELDSSGEAYTNRYITLDKLKDKKAPSRVIELVEQYNPETQAVVTIEYELDELTEPEIVDIPADLLPSRPN
jgi:hypothetical protein